MTINSQTDLAKGQRCSPDHKAQESNTDIIQYERKGETKSNLEFDPRDTEITRELDHAKRQNCDNIK